MDCKKPAEFIDVDYAARHLAHELPAIAITAITKQVPILVAVKQLTHMPVPEPMFYGKCRVFENIAYGVNVGGREYTDEGIASLKWMF